MRSDLPGYPGFISPRDVVERDDYEEVVGGTPGTCWPSASQTVVRHKPTGSLWHAYWSVRDDDSDYAEPTQWRACVRRERTIVEYVDA